MSKKRVHSRKIPQGGAPVSQRSARHVTATRGNVPSSALVSVLHGDLVLKKEGPVLHQLLKSTIMARRRAQGLDNIAINMAQQEIKHELTPEELEKKERRKEQNRRAARKCRLKKKMMQNVASTDYLKVLEDNERMEREIAELKTEKQTLKQILDDHVMSGNCRHFKQEADAPSVTSLSTVTSSTTSLSTAPTSTSTTAVSDVGSQPAFFNHEVYLEGLGPIAPEQTFTDLDLENVVMELDLQTLEEAAAAVSASSTTASSSFSTTMAAVVSIKTDAAVSLPPSSQQPQSVTLPLSLCPSFLSEDPGTQGEGCTHNPMDTLKGLRPPPLCLYSPISSPSSPASTLTPSRSHDRHPSTSSVASDWSSVSDHSQGFQLVPVATGGGGELAFYTEGRPSAAPVPHSLGSFSSDAQGEEAMDSVSGLDGETDAGTFLLMQHWAGGREPLDDDVEEDDVFLYQEDEAKMADQLFRRC